MSRHPLPRGPVEARIDGFTHGGEGVARLEGKAVFVAGTIPGELVRLRVTDDRKRWARADLMEVLEPSTDRVVPPCPFVPACGGCDLQHIAPGAQRRLKTQVVTEQLQRLGGIDTPPVQPCRAVGPDTGYRNHAQLHADDDGRLGFHRAGSHDVVPIDLCLILSDAAQDVRRAVGDGTGAVEVAVRAHPTTGSAAAQLTPGPGPLELPDGDFDVVLTQPDGRTLPVRGTGELTERVADLTYTFDTSSFFQVTTHGAAAIVDRVLDAVGDVTGALVWDLYAGVGLLSLPLARAGAEVVAVEGHAPAAAHAVSNAARHNLDLEVLVEDVATVTARIAGPTPDRDPPDVVVLDPPRAGAGKRVIDDLVRIAPASIVYVACDVAALARDTRLLTDGGYRLLDAVPLDLFPMTHHVEVVATFGR